MKRGKNFGAVMVIAGSIISIPLLAHYTYASYLGIVFIAIGLWDLLGLSFNNGTASACEFSVSQEDPFFPNDQRMKYLLANSHYTSASSFERILQCNIDDGSTVCFTVKNCNANVHQPIQMIISQYYDAGKIQEIFRKEVGAEQTVSKLLLVSGAMSTYGRILFEVKCFNEKSPMINIEACVTQQ